MVFSLVTILPGVCFKNNNHELSHGSGSGTYMNMIHSIVYIYMPKRSNNKKCHHKRIELSTMEYGVQRLNKRATDYFYVDS